MVSAPLHTLCVSCNHRRIDHLAAAACDYGDPRCDCPAFEQATATVATSLERSQVLSETLRRLVHRSDDFAEAFYLRLYDRYPDIRERFVRLDRAMQRAKLWAALTTIANAGGAIPGFVDYLGVSHDIEGVRPDDYTSFVEVLLETLESFTGDAWPESLRDAWTSVLDEVTRAMIAAAGASRA